MSERDKADKAEEAVRRELLSCMSRERVDEVMALVTEYGHQSWRDGYDEGIYTANSDWP